MAGLEAPRRLAVTLRVLKGEQREEENAISFIYQPCSIPGLVRLGNNVLIFQEFLRTITKENEITDWEGKLLCSVL